MKATDRCSCRLKTPEKNSLGRRPLSFSCFFFFSSAELDVPLHGRRRGEAQPRLDGLERGVKVAVVGSSGGVPKSHCVFVFSFLGVDGMCLVSFGAKVRALLRRCARACDEITRSLHALSWQQ